MYGKNPLRKQIIASSQKKSQQYWVQSVFSTIQGEGPLAGTPAVFLRLAGCNLRCWFCDTDFESSTWRPSLEELGRSVSAAFNLRARFPVEKRQLGIKLVVLTGGEPFRQQILPLVEHLNSFEYVVQVETAGTVVPVFDEVDWKLFEKLFRVENASGNMIVVSPKTGKLSPVYEGVWDQYLHAWKYIIRDQEIDPHDGLPYVSTQVKERPLKLARPTQLAVAGSRVYVQPCDEYDPGANERNLRACIDVAIRFGYRVSLQQHKIMGLE